VLIRHNRFAKVQSVNRFRLLTLTLFGALAGSALPALAQGLPSFALSGPVLSDGQTRWDGQYLKLSSGFSVTSFRHGGTVAGPTLGLAAGRMWQQGALVWGIEGALDYQPATYRSSSRAVPAFAEFNRDLMAGARFKAGILAQDNLLFYGSVGGVVARETWRYSPAAVAQGITGIKDERVQLRPDIRAGVEWAVTDKIRLNLEVATQPGWR
jgi:outer membrane immunogenic protein